MDFQSIPNLVPHLIFRAWIVTDQFCCKIPLQLDREGIKERQDGERGGGGAIIQGRQLFQIFPWRGAIIQERRLIEESIVIILGMNAVCYW